MLRARKLLRPRAISLISVQKRAAHSVTLRTAWSSSSRRHSVSGPKQLRRHLSTGAAASNTAGAAADADPARILRDIELGLPFLQEQALSRLADVAAEDESFREAIIKRDGIRSILAILKSPQRDASLEQRLRPLCRKALATLGHNELPLHHTRRGLRVICFDGGGTRALITIRMLKEIQKQAGGKPLHELFDLFCGVSTGSILAFYLGVKRVSLEELEHLFIRFGAGVFARTPVITTAKMLWNRASYSPEVLTSLFKEQFGDDFLIDSMRDPLTPRVIAVSTVVNRAVPMPYLFRNYVYAPGADHKSKFAGSCTHRVWEALRCSTAAPSFFPPYQIGADVHEDGGLIANNPSAIALHEAQRIWKGAPLECLLSVGTGRVDPAKTYERKAVNATWLDLLSTLTSSAVSTETLHSVLEDLLSPDTYFRFNPVLKGAALLDEYRPSELSAYSALGEAYIQSPRQMERVARLAQVLRGEHYQWFQKALPPYPFPLQFPPLLIPQFPALSNFAPSWWHSTRTGEGSAAVDRVAAQAASLAQHAAGSARRLAGSVVRAAGAAVSSARSASAAAAQSKAAADREVQAAAAAAAKAAADAAAPTQPLLAPPEVPEASFTMTAAPAQQPAASSQPDVAINNGAKLNDSAASPSAAEPGSAAATEASATSREPEKAQ